MNSFNFYRYISNQRQMKENVNKVNRMARDLGQKGDLKSSHLLTEISHSLSSCAQPAKAER